MNQKDSFLDPDRLSTIKIASFVNRVNEMQKTSSQLGTDFEASSGQLL